MLRTFTSSRSAQRPHINSGLSQLLRTCVRHNSSSEHDSRGGASAKLWADAIAEEKVEAENANKHKPPTQVNEYPNWTGEESMQDAVLRMLVDKYKPLRGMSIKTAEEKLKSAPPSLRGPLGPYSYPPVPDNSSSTIPTSTSSATVNPDTHKPWLTTFRAPSHATSIRHMRLPPSPVHSNARVKNPPIHPEESRARIEQREKKRKAAHAGRLTNARESSLDYRIGKTARHQANPVSVKGWTSLVEERIERARSEGHFRTIKGRGQPMVQEDEERNPFIPREEFLMNRIVQRQGAAPPWVETQGELDAAITSFRTVLKSAWTRRAVRTLTLDRPPALLSRLTLADVTGPRMHDPEWEAREAGYHEGALSEINALVRKYNGVAPYAVRRTFLTKKNELDRMYGVSGEDILNEIRRKAALSAAGAVGTGSSNEETDGGHGNGEGGELKPLRFRDMWHRWMAKFVGG